MIAGGAACEIALIFAFCGGASATPAPTPAMQTISGTL